RLDMTLEGKLVLFRATDFPLLGHQLAVLAHRQARARLAHPGRDRLEVTRAQAEPGANASAERLAARTVTHDVRKRLAVDDRSVAGGIDAAGDCRFDFAAGDALRELHRRGQTGAAGALHIVRGRLRMKAGALCCFTREIPVARMLDDGAGGNFSQLFTA